MVNTLTILLLFWFSVLLLQLTCILVIAGSFWNQESEQDARQLNPLDIFITHAQSCWHSMWVRGSDISRRVITPHSIPLWAYTPKDDSPCSVLHKLLTPWAVLVLYRNTGWTLHILSTGFHCVGSLNLLHPPACAIPSLCAGSQKHPSRQIYGTCVDCLHSARRADLTLSRGIGLVPNRLSAPQTLKCGAQKGFCYACRDFHCLDIQQNSTARINPLGQVWHPGMAGW